jgi:putative methionine-R-sulfoxide reductase with GAF domain
MAVLDVDSDRLRAFVEVDKMNLEKVCALVGAVGLKTV